MLWIRRRETAKIRWCTALPECAAAQDEVRACKREGDFGDRFIDLACSVFETNDRGAAVKRRINKRLGSELIEEKSYCAMNSAGDLAGV